MKFIAKYIRPLLQLIISIALIALFVIAVKVLVDNPVWVIPIMFVGSVALAMIRQAMKKHLAKLAKEKMDAEYAGNSAESD